MLLEDSVTYSDHLVLYYLRQHNADSIRITHAEIAAAIGMPKRTVERSIGRLTNAGLIERVTLSGDRVNTYRIADANRKLSA